VAEFEIGDRVRIDIPDETDPDYAEFHGKHGKIVSTLEDNLSGLTGEPEHDKIYRVEVEDGRTVDLRHHDLRPPIE
jgi:ribosomal protein L21E